MRGKENMERENYLCLLELLNFDNVVLQGGNDMLQIRLDRMTKDLSEASRGKEEGIVCRNFGSYILLSTLSDDEESLERLLSVLSVYNKQALMFGYPHKGIVLRQKPAVSKHEGVEVFNSRAFIEAKSKLAKQDIAGIVIDEEVYAESKETVQRYSSTFGQKQVLKIFKAALAGVAFEEVKKTLRSNFAKVGAGEGSSEEKALKSLLEFMEAENR